MDKIKQYQIKCQETYKEKVGIPSDYSYLSGNPVKVHIPVETTVGKVMIIGAYPTAYFNKIKSEAGKIIRDVPMGDHISPFSNEEYPYGNSIRKIKSGTELENHYLQPLGLPRADCWITNLVKVFLFKEGHINKYNELGAASPSLNRKQYRDLAEKSLIFIKEEIEIAQPKVILSLGSELAAILFNVSEKKAKKEYMTAMPHELIIHDQSYQCFSLPHPGIIMKNTGGSEKWRNILKNQIEEITKIIPEK